MVAAKERDRCKRKTAMISVRVFLFVFIFVFSALCAHSENEKVHYKFKVPIGMTLEEAVEKGEVEIPPGMEMLKIGKNSAAIVPKGTLVHKDGGQIFVESVQQYAARRFEAMEKRLSEIMATQKTFQKEINLLKASLDKVQKAVLSSDKK